MHSYSHPKWEGSLHYNSDLSGDVKIVVSTDERNWKEIDVPGFILLDFIAEFVANQRVAYLEQARAGEILGLPDVTYVDELAGL